MLHWPSLVLVFIVSLSLASILASTPIGRIFLATRRNDLSAEQALHTRPTPRTGGVAVVIAALLVLFVLALNDALFGLIALTLIPVFIAGLAEDLGFQLSPVQRLFAAAVSAWMAMLLLDIWIPASGIPVVDTLLTLVPFAIPFTLLWSVGICHGFNLIDGVNGLAAGTGVIIAAGLGVVAWEVGELSLAQLAFALIPAILGFLALNWPWGRIFLGDSGAYSIGHLLVWVAILLAWRVPDVSSAALSLMFFWPVADTFLAVYRRRSQRRPFDAPDRMHFHQVTYRLLSARLGHRCSRLCINSLTGLFLLPFTAVPVVVATQVWDRPVLALVAWVIFAALFVGVYRVSVWAARRHAWRSLWLRPLPLDTRAQKAHLNPV
jgi:UDP-GlcNAc:undecaprenyl-phosphate/decaprenyl-phosphate GlcNAc-1-phosphate transferase